MSYEILREDLRKALEGYQAAATTCAKMEKEQRSRGATNPDALCRVLPPLLREEIEFVTHLGVFLGGKDYRAASELCRTKMDKLSKADDEPDLVSADPVVAVQPLAVAKKPLSKEQLEVRQKYAPEGGRPPREKLAALAREEYPDEPAVATRLRDKDATSGDLLNMAVRKHTTLLKALRWLVRRNPELGGTRPLFTRDGAKGNQKRLALALRKRMANP